MKKVVIALFFTIAFVSCVGLKAEKQVGEWKNFFGEWSKNNTEEGEYFILDFRSDNDTLVEISYSVMGPFEEILYGKLISKTKVELYFNYIMGSISFANVTKQNEARLEKCKKKKVADCTINPDGTMTLQTYSDNCGQLPPNTIITLVKNNDISDDKSNNISGDNYFDEDDPLSELIVQYTPEQLKQIIGKAEPKDVADLLLLLPETDFLLYFNFTVEQRKKMLEGETISYVELYDIDVKNGYISSGYEGTWEMFAKKIDGIWWIAVYENNCAEFCNTIQAKTYTYSEGKLVQRNHANLAGFQDVLVEMFIDLDQLTETQKKLANDIWNKSNAFNDVLFQLPRDGKTITMYIESYHYIEAGIPESAIKKVTKELWQ